jgi:hypothetical protein
MFRRAIPLLFLVALLGLGPGLPEYIWNIDECTAAPVPAGPKADDSVSPRAISLLQYRKVQKELKMTAEQRVVVLDGLADIEEQYQEKFGELAQMSTATDEQYEKLDKDREKATELLLTGAAKSLTAGQQMRLRQLDRRLRGPLAFVDPQVEKKLQLTDDQKKKAVEVAGRIKTALERYLDNNDNETEAKRKADLFRFRKARLKELEDALTADQKTAWATLLGDAPTGFVVDDLWLKIEVNADE